MQLNIRSKGLRVREDTQDGTRCSQWEVGGSIVYASAKKHQLESGIFLVQSPTQIDCAEN